MSRRTNRRDFLQTGTATVAGLWLAPSIAARAAQRAAANDRIAVAMIGCGKMANDYHLPSLLGSPLTQVVAVCDVDQTRREHAQQRVDQHYSDAKRDFKGCAAYVHFRDVLTRDDIDAVCIATPDHWHAIPLIEACRAGKDVYCEKPLTLSLAEAQRCVEAARQFGRVVQTGSQQRSGVFGPFREAVDIIRSGRLGRIDRVSVGVGGPSRPCDLPGEELEPGLEWDLWLGPAPWREYNSVLSPRGVHTHFPNWRAYREYSGGTHTDIGAHHYDIAHWALELDQSGPIEIIPPDDPNAERGVRYRYPGDLIVEHGGPGGCVFHGENGWLRIDRGHLSSQPESIVTEPLPESATRLAVSPGHHQNWLDCILTRERPIADVEAGARTVATILLGNLAYWHREPIGWDPQTWRFTNPSQTGWLDYQRREAWPLPSLDS